MAVMEFISCTLKVTQETIPRGIRWNHRPYWSQELQELLDATSEAREAAKSNPSLEDNTKLQKTKARSQAQDTG